MPRTRQLVGDSLLSRSRACRRSLTTRARARCLFAAEKNRGRVLARENGKDQILRSQFFRSSLSRHKASRAAVKMRARACSRDRAMLRAMLRRVYTSCTYASAFVQSVYVG